jgi:hypothetical protein
MKRTILNIIILSILTLGISSFIFLKKGQVADNSANTEVEAQAQYTHYQEGITERERY